jgi:hypothetical protein
MTQSRLLLCWIALVLSFPTAYAAEYDIFIGDYSGKYIPSDGDKKRIRDLSVKIRKVKGGLNISWVTTTYKKNKPKKKKYSIDFSKTNRKYIYEASQKKNVFGGRDPLDPMKGEPYAWARIKGRTLTVFVLIIADDGGYEIQTYDRILNEDNNLVVQFSRLRNGDVMRTLEVTLQRETPGRTETDK